MYKLVVLVTVFVLFSGCAFAQDYLDGTTMLTLTKYECTVQKVEFSTGGTNWVTAAEGDQISNPTMDIASVNFDALVARFAQDLTLPVGTYMSCRLTIAPSFVIQGTVSYGGSTYYTKSGTGQPSTTTAPAEESTCINTGDEGNEQSYLQIVLGTLTISEDQTVTMRVVMSTDDCLGMTTDEGNYFIIPREPSWTFTQE